MNTLGNRLRVTVFGQSHAPYVGAVIEGLPVGMKTDEEALRAFLERRRSHHLPWQTPRAEKDEPRILCGIENGTVVSPLIAAVFENADTDSSVYHANVPRPGHADLAALMKYGEKIDLRGGGCFSGRLTLPLCFAGGLCLQLLAEKGITLKAEILSVGGEYDSVRFEEIMTAAREKSDSVGGEIRLVISGMPAGLGDGMFGGMENRLAAALFGIPAVKGVEFGDTRDCGSINNDGYAYDGEKIRFLSNHAGGILGGISTGEEIRVTLRVKPAPSVSLPQKSVDLDTGKDTVLTLSGRHDACILPRVLPCAEAAAACVIADMLMGG